MKRFSFSLLILTLLMLPAVSSLGDETSEVWSVLYEKAATLQQKYEIMLNIYEQDDRKLVPVLVMALDDMMRMRGGLSLSDLEVQKKIKILAIKKIGDFRVEEAAPLLYEEIQATSDPYVKGEAIIALGKTGSVEYAERIARILSDLNTSRGEDIRGEEAVAYGCVTALEKLKDPVGYIPILFASFAGYSRRVKVAAENALVTLVDDPSDILIGFMRDTADISLKLRAIEVAATSPAPPEKKVSVAIEAMQQGLSVNPIDREEATALRDLRLKAMETILVNGIFNDAAIHLIEKVLYLNYDVNETIYGLEVLGNFTGDEAAKTLTRFLAYQNDRQQSGVSAPDNRVIIATIRAIGRTGNPIGYDELTRVRYVGYAAVVGREAQRALDALKQ
jgi:hypothetical protein